MIPANELKKGNLFLCQLEVDKPEEICKVVWVTVGGIVNQHDGVCPYSACNPIALTPEWLEGCGFDGSGQFKNGKIIIECCSNLEVRIIEDDRCKYIMPFNKKVKIEHLHQLQNHYFALSGEELKIEL